MPRWLLAVFVLQLLWNMAGFPVMEHPYGRVQAEGVTVASGSSEHQPTPARGPGAAANGLLDELPDLPDSLLRRVAPKPSTAPTPAHAGWVQSGALDALLEALYRPPPRA